MWDNLKNLPPILVGQSIFNCLDLKSIITLETALGSSERILTFRSCLSYFTKIDTKVYIPEEMTKLKWLQSHAILITKVIMDVGKTNVIFETKMINKIELVDYGHVIKNSTIRNLKDSYCDKIVYICFDRSDHEADIMKKLFSRLHNLCEVEVSCSPDGWIESALQGLYQGSNNNVLIEKISFHNVSYGSVAEIAKYCPRLQSLSVEFDLYEDSLLALSTYCPLLKELNISSIPRIYTNNKQTIILCALALSCTGIYAIATTFLDDSDLSFIKTIPYLMKLQKFVAISYQDNVILSLITQYSLKLEIIEIYESSSIIPIQLLQFIQ